MIMYVANKTTEWTRYELESNHEAENMVEHGKESGTADSAEYYITDNLSIEYQV